MLNLITILRAWVEFLWSLRSACGAMQPVDDSMHLAVPCGDGAVPCGQRPVHCAGVGSAAALGTQSIASPVQWNLGEKVEKDFRLEVECGSRPAIHIDDSVIVRKLSRSLGQNFPPAPPRSLLAGDAKFLYHPRPLIHL